MRGIAILAFLFSVSAFADPKPSFLSQIKAQGTTTTVSHLNQMACSKEGSTVLLEPAQGPYVFQIEPTRDGWRIQQLWRSSFPSSEARLAVGLQCEKLPSYFVRSQEGATQVDTSMNPGNSFLKEALSPEKAYSAEEGLKIHLAELERLKNHLPQMELSSLYPGQKLGKAVGNVVGTSQKMTKQFQVGEGLSAQVEGATKKQDSALLSSLQKKLGKSWGKLNSSLEEVYGTPSSRELFEDASLSAPVESGLHFSGKSDNEVLSNIQSAFFGIGGKAQVFCRKTRFVAVTDPIWGKHYVDCHSQIILNPVEWSQAARWIDASRLVVTTAEQYRNGLSGLRQNLDSTQAKIAGANTDLSTKESSCQFVSAPVSAWTEGKPSGSLPKGSSANFVRLARVSDAFTVSAKEIPTQWQSLFQCKQPKEGKRHFISAKSERSH